MRRVVAAVLVLVVLTGGLIVESWAPPVTAAQTESTLNGHPLIGSWLIYETNPPTGREPVLTAVATFFADGNAVVSGFGVSQLQGSWIADSRSEATFTVVAPDAGGFGDVNRVRASVQVATDGGPFRGSYSFDIVRPDGTLAYSYRGPIAGQRVEVQAPDPFP
jgi:hypothetical protein